MGPKTIKLAKKNSLARASFHASATCGEMKTPDHYCDMWFNECDYCLKDDSNATRRHPIENVIDGSESFWMSPPLSRNTLDNDYSKVNITIDLKQVRILKLSVLVHLKFVLKS